MVRAFTADLLGKTFRSSVTSKKSPNVYESHPKIKDFLTPLQKFPNNVRALGKLIVAKGFEKLPKVLKIALSGHTDFD